MITASIVTYNNNQEDLKKAINSFLNMKLNIKLYISDNSSNREIANLCNDERIEYIYNNANLGFGTGHNIAIKKALQEGSKYHLILNPDVYFENGVIEKLYNYMNKNEEVGLIMPKILYPDGKVQYLAKLLPTPFDLILRRFIPIKTIRNKLTTKYELRFTGYNKIMNVPFLSGCFMLFRTSVLNEIGLFDERYFMYMEDVDISRRIHKKYKTIFYPYVTIIHNYEKGSYKNFKLLCYHISSAIKYFNKWGWFFDKERKFINKKFLDEYYRSNV